MRRSRVKPCAAVCGALMVVASGAASAGREPARADHSSNGFLAMLWLRAQESLDRASAELEPPLVPPAPVKVRWRARRVSSVDLAAPLLAVDAGDLDGDRRAELVALTTREVVVLKLTGKRRLAVAGRVSLPDDAPPIRPRDPVGAVVVVDIDGNGTAEILARSSDSRTGGSYAWREGSLQEIGRFAGFPLGRGAFTELEPGRNYFLADATSWPKSSVPPIPSQFYSAQGREDMVDPIGRPQWAVGFVTPDGELALRLSKRCRAGDDECSASQVTDLLVADVGVAFEIADVNRDGLPEVITSSSGAPGDPDRATVFTLRGARPEKVFRRKFNGGVVGLAAADVDGDGDLEVIAAVRLLGSHRVDVWTLN